jgi:hypothetical protein
MSKCKWLSFDSKQPATSATTSCPGSPVDDDEILHRIMIRAAILASDETLASRKLLRQIRS